MTIDARLKNQTFNLEKKKKGNDMHKVEVISEASKALMQMSLPPGQKYICSW